MKLIKYRHAGGETGVGQLEGDRVLPLDLGKRPFRSLTEILDAEDVREVVDFLTDTAAALSTSAVAILAPIDQQEVWAAGVTYQRSQAARMEESEAAASCYDRVYAAERPELFFKATAHRVVGTEEPVRIRHESTWCVPEPELTLVLNSRLDLVGYTVGNDMSSRDIEGANPLYLPQAKIYDACCSLGPCITLAASMPPRQQIGIRLAVYRDAAPILRGETTVAKMARPFEELIGYLGRDCSFPTGVFLLTGTGIVPDSDFALIPGDRIEISIDGIGTLANSVVQD